MEDLIKRGNKVSELTKEINILNEVLSDMEFIYFYVYSTVNYKIPNKYKNEIIPILENILIELKNELKELLKKE